MRAMLVTQIPQRCDEWPDDWPDNDPAEVGKWNIICLRSSCLLHGDAREGPFDTEADAQRAARAHNQLHPSEAQMYPCPHCRGTGRVR